MSESGGKFVCYNIMGKVGGVRVGRNHGERGAVYCREWGTTLVAGGIHCRSSWWNLTFEWGWFRSSSSQVIGITFSTGTLPVDLVVTLLLHMYRNTILAITSSYCLSMLCESVLQVPLFPTDVYLVNNLCRGPGKPSISSSLLSTFCVPAYLWSCSQRVAQFILLKTFSCSTKLLIYIVVICGI